VSASVIVRIAHHCNTGLLIVAIASNVACDQPKRNDTPSGAVQYEFSRDEQGRLMRLNKTTGEVTIVSGSSRPPVSSAKQELPKSPTASPRQASRQSMPTTELVPDASEQHIISTVPQVDTRSMVHTTSPPVGSSLTLIEPAPLFLLPDRTRTPLVTIEQGATVIFLGSEGQFYRVEYRDRYVGLRTGYVLSQAVKRPPSSHEVPIDLSIPSKPQKSNHDEPIDLSIRPTPLTPQKPIDLSVTPKAPKSGQARPLESIHGYVEWRRDGYIVADGQRVRWNQTTKVQPASVRVAMAPLGYEITALGSRLLDGSLLATKITLKPNSVAAFEREAQQSSDRVEQNWQREGMAFDVTTAGTRRPIGRITNSGPDIERLRNIVTKIVPPSSSPDRLRVRIIETKEWNAFVMENGSVWVYRGLLDELSNDELAIVVGHELAHYTHEHNRRSQRNGALVQLAGVFASVGLQQINSPAKYEAAKLTTVLSLDAWQNGYQRSLEDQADRVGLRYAFEGGFDVTQGPRLWTRIREREGQLDKISNFFIGDHSRPSERAQHLQREIQLNYASR
jgi:Zn-dependent protease with chaperone function